MAGQQSGNLNSKRALIARLRRGTAVRSQFVDSNLTKSIAVQLRATRDQLRWSQERLANETGMNQNAISRLESPGYGKPTITTLKRLAAAMDVGLMVHFVPFSQMIDWTSGTPRTDHGLNTAFLAVPTFTMEEETGVFETNSGLIEHGPQDIAALARKPQRALEDMQGDDNVLMMTRPPCSEQGITQQEERRFAGCGAGR